jgi:hypothetical protein
MTRLLPLALLLGLGGCLVENQISGVTDPEEPADTDDPDGGVDDPDPLEGMGAVEGRICAPNGETWVGGASVYVEHPDGRIAQTLSDSEGRFRLEGVAPGIHLLIVQKGSLLTRFRVEVFRERTTTLPERECLSQGDLKIAVVTGEFDQIQRILDRLGLEYDLVDGMGGSDHLDLLLSERRIDEYDLVFLNCGMDTQWWAWRGQVGENIHRYVRRGGKVYTSDMTYTVMEAAVPDALDFLGHDELLYHSNQLLGPRDLQGHVVDRELEVALGTDRVDVHYEGEGYYAAAESGGTARPLVMADFPYHPDQGWETVQTYGVLAAVEEVGQGRIIFTSFHNEAQRPDAMDTLLEALVLTL